MEPTRASTVGDIDGDASILEYTGDDIETAGEETPSLNFVWGVFKASDTAAKLILPDMLSRPFYLPSPRATKADKDAKLEKELKRLDFICERDSQYSAPSDRRSMLNLIPDFGLKGRERVIEKKLVDPYRKDPHKRAELIREVMEREARMEPVKKVVVVPKPPEARPSVISRELRHTMVIQRHATIIESAQESIAEYAQRMEEKRQKVQETMEQQSLQQATYRKAKWLQVVMALGTLRVMYGVVYAARKLKAQDPQRWNACLKIQKWFRKIVFFKLKRNIKGCRPSIRVNNVIKMLREAAIRAGGERCLYSQRKKACTVITTFLLELQGRMSVYVRKYISKIKNLQFFLKRHFSYNALRIALVERLIEVCLPVLLQHMELVHQGRGHDLKNLTSYDLNKLNSVDRLTARISLVHKMNCAAFHAYLRTHLSQLPIVMSVFKAHGGRTSRNMMHGKDEIFDLLQRKRREHIINLERAKVVQLNIPKFHTEHIKTFIHGGEDPLHSFLLDAQRAQNIRHAAEQAVRNSKFARAASAARNNSMLLLTSIDCEDLTFLVMSVAAKLADTKVLRTRHSGAMGAAGSVEYAPLPSLAARSSDSDGTEALMPAHMLSGPHSVRIDSRGSGGVRSPLVPTRPAAATKSMKASPAKSKRKESTLVKDGASLKVSSPRPATPPKASKSSAESPQKAARKLSASSRGMVPPVGSPV